MKKLFYLLLFASCMPKSQEVLRPGSDLRVGETTPVRTLAQHQADTFRLELDSGAFVYGYADQRTVDLVVTILGPDRQLIDEFDQPSEGHEKFSFATRSAGTHRMVVAPFKDKTGDYTLTLRAAEPRATDPEGVTDQYMRANLGDHPLAPGAAVAIEKEGKIIFSKGYGYADLESERKITPTTIFHIASVSKQFTAFAIALLADQGKISMQDDIRKYLPELHDFGTVITIDHLVHHTSGLRDQWNLLMMAGWRLDDVITREQILRIVSKQRELNFKPGDEYLYCNTGFTLMAEIVSRVTGEAFPDWTRKNIFEPLGMNNTLFYDDHEKVVKNRAYSYYKESSDDPGAYKKSVLSYANAGATSLFTTVEDLGKWARNFETMQVGNARVMAEMNRRFVLNRGDTISYAFGQAIRKYKGLNTASHGGGDAGYRTFLLRFPDQHLSISVFSNFAWFDPGSLSYALADLLLADQLQPEKPGAPPQPEEEKKPFDPESVVLSDFTGSFYSDELETRYTFDIRNDTLTSHHQRHDDFKLQATAADTFTMQFLGTLVFTRDAKGKVNGFKASNGRVRNLAFRKEM